MSETDKLPLIEKMVPSFAIQSIIDQQRMYIDQLVDVIDGSDAKSVEQFAYATIREEALKSVFNSLSQKCPSLKWEHDSNTDVLSEIEVNDIAGVINSMGLEILRLQAQLDSASPDSEVRPEIVRQAVRAMSDLTVDFVQALKSLGIPINFSAEIY